MLASLDQLKQMNPEDLKLTHLSRDPDVLKRLEWLLEMRPQETWKEFSRNRKQFKKSLLLPVKRATLMRLILEKESDLPPGGVEEMVSEILAPIGQPFPEEMQNLSEDQELQIRDWVESLYSG